MRAVAFRAADVDGDFVLSNGSGFEESISRCDQRALRLDYYDIVIADPATGAAAEQRMERGEGKPVSQRRSRELFTDERERLA
jgi:hypothetical protein